MIIMCMVRGPLSVLPRILVSYQGQPGTPPKEIELAIPVYTNKIVEKVEAMPEQAFKKNWDEITFNRPDEFQKLDTIMKNPAPPNVPIEAVLT